LPDSAGFDIDDPDLAAAAAVGYEGDVPAIGCPGWIFVSAGRRELPDPPSADVNQKDLRAAGYLSMEYDAGPVGRPLRSIRTSGGAEVERRQQLLIGSIGSHHVQLGRSGSRRDERDAPPVWRKRWA
jgi:hypothetical protein